MKLALGIASLFAFCIAGTAASVFAALFSFSVKDWWRKRKERGPGKVFATVALALSLASPSLASDARVETIRPDGTEAENQTDCTTSDAHTNTQDDPDAPDANWCSASSGTVNTVLDMTLDNPAIDPKTSAGALHVMRAWVRKNASGGSDPTCRLDAYEDETLRTTGTDTTITSATGEIIAETFEMSGWTDTTGDIAEVRITCISNGGGPNARTGDIGAVEVRLVTNRQVHIN